MDKIGILGFVCRDRLLLISGFTGNRHNNVITFFQTFTFRGSDMSKVPCFKETAMNSIGLSAASGVIYNFSTSKNPIKIVGLTYFVTFFGTW